MIDFLRKHNRFLLFWILSLSFQYPFIQTFIVQDPYLLIKYPITSFALHISSVILFSLSISRAESLDAYAKLRHKSLLIYSFLIPFFGCLGSGFIYFFSFVKKAQVNLYDDDEYFYPLADLDSFLERGKKTQTKLVERIDIVPLVDLLEGDDLDLKRGAVEKLAELKTQESIKVLKKYRNDSSYDLRFYVTSALARLKREFEEELEAAKEGLIKNNFQLSDRLKLAKNYLNYTCSSLLEDVAVDRLEEEAKYHFAKSVDVFQEDDFWAYYKLLLQKDDFIAAKELVSQCEALSNISSLTIQKAKILLAFEKREFSELPLLFQSDVNFSDEWKSLSQWWMQYT